MARIINKTIASATIHYFIPSKPFEVDENGMPKANETLFVDGNPSPNKARILGEKAFKTKNLMVVSIEVDETKLKVEPMVFLAHSDVCEDGVSYSREFVTQQFEYTRIWGFCFEDGNMKPFEATYEGKTTANKLLNYVRETHGQTAVITNSEVCTERRYMPRSKYLELAQ